MKQRESMIDHGAPSPDAVPIDLFPDIAPGRPKYLAAIARALGNTNCRIYVDASVLTLGYDINAGARDEMLRALGQFEQRLHVPLWAAHETWNNGSKKRPGRPLDELKQKLEKAQEAYLTSALSQLDEEFVAKDRTLIKRSDFANSYRQRAKEVSKLVNSVDGLRQPRSSVEAVTAFINRHVIRSDLASITSRVMKEGPFRHAHGIPPGHADSRKAGKREDESESPIKNTNQFGDLIIWFEILEHALECSTEEVVVLTRDVNKRDWTYCPHKVRDKDDRVVQNSGTHLPLPLLLSEAISYCPSLNQLHIVSLAEFVRLFSSHLSQPLPQLSVALQSEDGPPAARPTSENPQAQGPAPLDATPDIEAFFSVSDLQYQFVETNRLDALIQSLSVSEWSGQNRAAKELDALSLAAIPRKQSIQIGIALAKAVKGLAVDPAETLAGLLKRSEDLQLSVNVLIGALAEIYLNASGELVRPTSPPNLTGLVFEAAALPHRRDAVDAILSRLSSQRKYYLALPNEPVRSINLEIGVSSVDQDSITSITADGISLVEQNAPRSRRLPNAGSEQAISGEELVDIVSNQFAVPSTFFNIATSDSKFKVSDSIGFIRWGPGSGFQLRHVHE